MQTRWMNVPLILPASTKGYVPTLLGLTDVPVIVNTLVSTVSLHLFPVLQTLVSMEDFVMSRINPVTVVTALKDL